MMRFSNQLATVLAASAVSCLLSEQRVCTLVGCDSNVGFRVFETADGIALLDATLRVCRNDVCSEARISELPTVDDFQGPPLGVEGELSVEARVYSLSSGYELSATIWAQGEFPYGLADGDVYTLTLRDRDSVLLSSQAWTATYAVSEPNGPDCEPTCLRASLAPRP